MSNLGNIFTPKQVVEVKKLSQQVLRDKKERAARAEAYQKQIVDEVQNRKQDQQHGKKKLKSKLLEKVEINVEMDEDFDEMEIDEYFEPLDLVPHFVERPTSIQCLWPANLNISQLNAGGFTQEVSWQRAISSTMYLN